MAKVHVDSDDLEILLMATGVIKAMESAIKTATADEQWRAAQPKITAAHNRLVDAWRGALREQQYPEPIKKPSPQELAMLRGLADQGATAELGMPVDNPHFYRQMIAHGLVKIGSLQSRVLWDGETVNVTHSAQPRLKLTDRAKEYLDAHPEEKPKRGWLRWLG